MPSQPTQHDDWPEHIATWRSSKLTRIEHCRQHDLKLHAFIYTGSSGNTPDKAAHADSCES